MTVGGEVVTDPARDVGEGDDVRVDGSPVGVEAREVWALHKPAGVVSTASEPGERPAVVYLVESRARLYPVGRLDADSTGLILLTNDGELANRLTHPRYEVARPTAWSCAGRRARRTCAASPTASTSTTARPRPPRSGRLGEREIEIVLREGRNRQLRRMAEAMGNRVLELSRVRVGSLELGDLPRARRAGSRRTRSPPCAMPPACRLFPPRQGKRRHATLSELVGTDALEGCRG